MEKRFFGDWAENKKPEEMSKQEVLEELNAMLEQIPFVGKHVDVSDGDEGVIVGHKDTLPGNGTIYRNVVVDTGDNRPRVFGFPNAFKKGILTGNEDEIEQWIRMYSETENRQNELAKRLVDTEKIETEKKLANAKQFVSDALLSATEVSQAVTEAARNLDKAYYDKLIDAYIRYLKKRGVEYFVHYTSIRNIRSILQLGLLPCSRVPCDAVLNDGGWLSGQQDAVCLSVTYSNELMYHAQRKKADYDFDRVLLRISVDVLREFTPKQVFFYPHNGAFKTYRENREKQRSFAALESMFSDEQITGDGSLVNRRRNRIPDNVTTDPQAEVNVYGVIPVEYIKAIVFDERKYIEMIDSDVLEKTKIRLIPDNYPFSKREDRAFWCEHNKPKDGSVYDDFLPFKYCFRKGA